MGSLFSTPKPTAASASSVRTPAPQTPTAVSTETTEQATRTARQEALERRRYGRAGLIATGYRTGSAVR